MEPEFISLGYRVHFHLYQGGHEIRPWKEEFASAVQWLLSADPEGAGGE